MKRILALVGRSALAGVIFAVTFCAGVALLLGGVVWWIQRPDAGNDGGLVPNHLSFVRCPLSCYRTWIAPDEQMASPLA